MKKTIYITCPTGRRIFGMTILACLSCFFVNETFAKQVEASTAKKTAENFLYSNAKISSAELNLSYTEKSQSGDADFFIFDINNHSGFIIISADDAVRPVIGYSTEKSFVKPSATSNPNFNFWMEGRKSEIEFARNNNIQADEKIKNEWYGYSANKITPPIINTVQPLCDAEWGQQSPYNDLCPQGALVGCVATAMAEIMRKWNYPTTGTGSSSYNSNNYGQQSANYGATTYNWSAMTTPMCMGSNNDVATIMYHCGVSVQMDYGTSVSLAMLCCSNPSAKYAFPTYFGYDPGIQYKDQSTMTTASWISLLETEFNAGRPVMYQGVDPNGGGHGWVADGYDASDMMHMNWGWDGQANGYYDVNNVSPSGTGLNFTQYLAVLANIHPASATSAEEISSESSISVYPNPSSDFFVLNSEWKNCSVKIFDVTGNLVKDFSNINQFPFTMEKGNISSGMYFLELKSENKTDRIKLLIQ